MGARAKYSRWGGMTAPTNIGREKSAGRSKAVKEFFNASATPLKGDFQGVAGLFWPGTG
jgi:hypothetical protein